MARIEQKQNDWLEPMKEWIKVASNLVKIARDSNLLEKKVAAKEIFGSNLRLASRAVRGEPVFPYLSALRATESIGKIPEKFGAGGGKKTFGPRLAAPDFPLAEGGKGGIEPPTSVLSGQRSTTELLAHIGEVKAGGSGLCSTTELHARSGVQGSNKINLAE